MIDGSGATHITLGNTQVDEMADNLNSRISKLKDDAKTNGLGGFDGTLVNGEVGDVVKFSYFASVIVRVVAKLGDMRINFKTGYLANKAIFQFAQYALSNQVVKTGFIASAVNSYIAAEKARVEAEKEKRHEKVRARKAELAAATAAHAQRMQGMQEGSRTNPVYEARRQGVFGFDLNLSDDEAEDAPMDGEEVEVE